MNKNNLAVWFKRNLFIVIFAVLGVVFAGLAAYRYSDAISIDNEMQAEQEKLDTMRRNSRMAVTLGGDLLRLKGYSDRVNETLINKEAKAGNLAYFYEVGTRTQVKVLHVDQRELAENVAANDAKAKKKVTVSTSYSKVQFDIGVEGSYAAILAYLEGIRAEHPLMRVDSLAIKPVTNASGRVEEASLLITVLTGIKEKSK